MIRVMIREQVRSASVAGVLYLIAFLVLVVALGFTIGGIYSAIEAPLGPIAASFIVAGGLAVLAVIFIIGANMALRRGKRRREAALDAFVEEHRTATGLGGIAGAFALGLAQGLARRRRDRRS